MTDGRELAYERYRTGSSTEWMMRTGPDRGVPVLFVPPLFEELNRMRALLASVMRRLAERGCRCVLPDLPGTGESSSSLERSDWTGWRTAVADAAQAIRTEAPHSPLVVASFRGGCLLDDAAGAEAVWRLSPVAGASLARDLVRSTLLHPSPARGEIRLLAGYPAPNDLLQALEAAEPLPGASVRTVRLEGDPGAADARIAGPALWRRSEPSNSTEMTKLIDCDLWDWMQLCAGS